MMMQAGNRDIQYRLRYSRRARRIRISVLPGSVSVTAPCGIPPLAVDLFVQTRHSWIREKLDLFEENPGPSSLVRPFPGEDIWIFGEKLVIRKGQEVGIHPSVDDGEFIVPANLLSDRKLSAVLDRLLMERIESGVRDFKNASGLVPSGIRLGNARTRWGSCAPGGRIMINRRLVHAPVFAVDYVVFHELTHLKHGNHSPAFWRDLGGVFANVREARKWLRLQGAHLT